MFLVVQPPKTLADQKARWNQQKHQIQQALCLPQEYPDNSLKKKKKTHWFLK